MAINTNQMAKALIPGILYMFDRIVLEGRLYHCMYHCLCAIYGKKLIGEKVDFLPKYSEDIFVDMILCKTSPYLLLYRYNCKTLLAVCKKFKSLKENLEDYKKIPTGPSNPDDPYCAAPEVIIARQRHRINIENKLKEFWEV